jgi:hypothetical protein
MNILTYCASHPQTGTSYLTTPCLPVHLLGHIIRNALHAQRGNLRQDCLRQWTHDRRAHDLSGPSIHLEDENAHQSSPRQGQELNDGEQRDAIRLIQLMPVPERNSQRTIRVRYLRAAFRDRSASGDVLISLSEMPSDNSIVWIMLRYLGDCSL